MLDLDIDIDRYRRDGFLVVPRFASADTCDTLLQRARALVDAFEPETVSIFSTNEQTRTSDEYFLESGSEVRFFFEEEAFEPGGALKRDKSVSINKIGHALHARDPEFARFSQDPRMARVASQLGQLADPRLVQS